METQSVSIRQPGRKKSQQLTILQITLLIKKPFEFQRTQRSGTTNCEGTYATGLPLTSHLKYIMFQVAPHFTNMRKCINTEKTEPLRRWQLLPRGTLDGESLDTTQHWLHAVEKSLHSGPAHHRSLVEDNLINQLSGCFYVAPGLYAFTSVFNYREPDGCRS